MLGTKTIEMVMRFKATSLFAVEKASLLFSAEGLCLGTMTVKPLKYKKARNTLLLVSKKQS